MRDTEEQRRWKALPWPIRIQTPYSRRKTLTEEWQTFWTFSSEDFYGGVAVVFSIAVLIFLHWHSMLPGIHHGRDMVVNALAIMFWFCWNVALCVLIAWPITRILPELPLAVRWVVSLTILAGPLVFAVGWFLFHKAGEHIAERKAAAAYEAAEQLKMQEIAEQEAIENAQARERAKQLANLKALRQQVTAKWREDLGAANAIGEPGVVPPMLKIKQTGTHISVTNLGPKPACLKMQRVAVKPQGVERCVIGGAMCVSIDRGATRQFQVFLSGNPPGCINAQLEYRVGTPLDPEPSWWSRTALADLERDEDKYTAPADAAPLESLLDEAGRAARWRRELNELASRTKR